MSIGFRGGGDGGGEGDRAEEQDEVFHGGRSGGVGGDCQAFPTAQLVYVFGYLGQFSRGEADRSTGAVHPTCGAEIHVGQPIDN